MKTIGIVRSLDNLGRIIVPRELRNTLGIKEDDPVEVFTDGECIVLKKYEPGCTFCGELDDTKIFRDKRVCAQCIKQMRESI